MKAVITLTFSSTGKDSSKEQISSRACSSSEVGSTSILDEFSSSRILRLNFFLINLNRSLTDRLFTRNLAVLEIPV